MLYKHFQIKTKSFLKWETKDKTTKINQQFINSLTKRSKTMASTSETGHAKNVANLAKLISKCIAKGR